MQTSTSFIPRASPIASLASAQMTLRPYQVEALAAIDQARIAGRRAALVCLPTGAGKTVLFAELVKRWDIPTVILAHRDELLTQARSKLRAVWPDADVGLLGGGRHELGHRVMIASVQALSRARWLAEVAAQGINLVIVDECHHAPARSYRRVLSALGAGDVAGAFLVGVTATPQRFDAASLAPVFGEAVYVATLPQLVADGWLADLRGVRVTTRVSLAGIHTRAGDFAADELANAVDTPERNTAIVAAYQRHAHGRQAIAFCASVAHAEHLALTFNAVGIRAMMVSGEMPKTERDQILAQYANGALEIVCNCAILTEGFDAPTTSCIILARPTRSQGLYLQMVGRGTRPAPGKVDCLVLDVADISGRHSLVQLPDLLGKAYTRAGRMTEASGRGVGLAEFAATATAFVEPPTWSLRETLEALQQAKAYPMSPTERTAQLVRQWTWTRAGSGWLLCLPELRQDFLLSPADGERFQAWRRSRQGDMQLLTPTPLALGWAQAVAESAAEKIVSGKAVLVDRSATWRTQPASEKQLAMLRRFRIPIHTGLTKGQASVLIDAHFARARSRIS